MGRFSSRARALIPVVVLFLAGAANATSFYFNVASGNINDGISFGNASPGVAGTDYPTNGDSFTIKKGSTATVPTGYGVALTSITMNASVNANAPTVLYLMAGSSIGVTGNIQMAGECLPNCAAGTRYANIYALAGSTLALNNSNIIDDASGNSVNGFYFWGASKTNPVYITASTGTFKSGAQGGADYRNSSWTYVSFNGLGNMDSGYCGPDASFRASSITWVNGGTFVMPLAGNLGAGCSERYTENSDFRNFSQTDGGGRSIFITSNNGNIVSSKNYFNYNTVSSDSTKGLSNGAIFETDAPSVTVRGNVWKNFMVNNAGTFGVDTFVSSNIFVTQYGTSGCIPGTNNLAGHSTWVHNFEFAGCSNAHFIELTGTFTVTDNIAEVYTEGNLQNQDGKFFIGSNAFSSGTVDHNILTAEVEGNEITTYVGGTATYDYVLYNHNTVWYSSNAASNLNSCSSVGEGYGGRTDYVQYISNNICAFDVATAGASIERDFNIASAAVKIATQDYNGWWNQGNVVSDPDNAKMLYMTTAPANGYGTHDVHANPQFVNQYVSMKNWDLSIGGVGTSTNVITNFLQMNGYGGTYNPAYNLDALFTYYKAGFTPQNSALKSVASDGGDIGALPVQVAAAAGTTNSANTRRSKCEVHRIADPTGTCGY